VSLDYYLARAAEAHAEANAAALQNVRERCLRSEAVWRAMAERVAATEAMRRSRYSTDEEPAVPMSNRPPHRAQ
jgi:hypothetical protein